MNQTRSRTFAIKEIAMKSRFCKIRLFGVLFVAGVAAFGAASAEPYQYGNLVADVPAGWSSTEITSPGITLVTFSEGADKAHNESALIWLEITPLVDTSPRSLVSSIVELSGVQKITQRAEQERPNYFELTFDARIDSEAVRASFYSFEKNAKLYVLAFLAGAESFDALNGKRLPLNVFNAGRTIEISSNTSEPESPPPATVLAKAGEFGLTQQMVEDTVALAEFLAAQKIDANDKFRLRREIINQLPSSTEQDRAAYRDVGELMRQLAKVGAMKRAEVRRKMMNLAWFDAQKSDEVSPFLNLVYRYNPVLGSDEHLRLIATRAAFDALLASNSFVATKAGLNPLTPAERDAYAEQVREGYASMNEKQKRYLANGEVSWLKLIKVWQTWDEKNQRKHLGIVGVNGIKSPDQVPQIARNLEHWAGLDASVQQVRKMIGLQGDMMVLQHLRSTLSVYGPQK